ncbi:Contactin/TAG-1 cell adhesion molecule [Fasciola hepatica]|uniref:Contactin/TAG-1 cell adhesion molecule n=1 Tax=Fasciola hepatica TaxID=6192 RepID=A0A4E0RN74_FASHE|nr:Contactin/TAG-1 cell adhesion molecule [Fasciola hepatica]
MNDHVSHPWKMSIILYTAAVVFTTSFLVNASNPWYGCPQDKDSDPDCPDGWFSFETNCYTFFTQTPLSYMEGRLNCERHGGLLLRIDSMAQHDFIAQKLEGFAVTRTMRWYTSGVMRPDSFGEFMWEGYPLIYQQVKTELLSLWIDQIPKPQDRSTFPANRTRIVYGSDGNRWGWYLDTATPQRNYVCQASKAIANQLLPTAMSLTYGTPVTSEPLRGPCFLSNPLDVLYVRKLSIEKYAELKCEANGNPQPTYNWYTVSTESRTDSSGRTTTWINRTLINPTADNQGRISISAGSLVIHSPDSATDSQLFQCEAKNSQGSILSRTVRIVFGQLETPQKQPRNERRVLAHKSETLPCDPPAHSPPDSLLYTIYMNKGDTLEPVIPDYRPNLFISQAKGLVGFSELTTLDTGTYVCMITMQFNGVRLFDSPKLPDMPFTVMHSNEPRQEPRIYDEFPAVWPSNPQRGQMVRLECFASGYSQVEGLKYSWRRLDGVPLRTNSLKDFNRVIEMPNIQPEDQGEYECSVEDSYGKKAKPKSLNLRITAKPFFTTPIHDTVVDFGATVLMTCEASAIPSPQHQWFRNGVDLSDLIARRVLDPTRYSINQTSDTRSTLRITNAQLTDNAMLTCLAWNSLGSESSCAELRVVQLAPTFAKHPVMPNEGMVGGTAVMECQPEGAPGMKTSWFHGTTALSPGTSTLDPETGTATCASQYCTLPNGNLLIVRLVDANAGEYTCVAKNALGEARSSAYLTVIPALQLSLKPVNRVVYQNSTVLLPCRAKSSPVLDVNYAWFFEGVEIKFDRLDLDARRYEVAQLLRPYGRYFGQLYITNVQFENSGNYSCAAETPLSTLASNALIQVAGPPGPCGGVIVDPQVGVNQVNVTWTVGNSHLFQITSFAIEANAFLDPRDKWTVVVSNLNINETQQLLPSGRRMTFVRNLAANMAYRLRIRAINQAGPGEPSLPSLFFTTLPTAPTKMPLNVTGGGGKHGTLVFQWVPLSRVDENGPNFRYRAHIRAKGDSEYGTYELWTTKSIEGGKFLQYTHMLGDNLYYKPYEVRLEAVNSKGVGPITDPVTVMSAARVPTNAPGGVTAGALNSSAITVWWTPPQPSEGEGPTWGYRILYWPRVSDCRSLQSDLARHRLGQRQTVHGDVTEGVIIGLDADTYYCIAVQIFNSAGDGPESSFTEQTTFKISPQDFPTMVTLNATDQPSTIRVSWVGIQARPNEESVEGYRIRFWPAGSQFKQTFTDVDVGLKTYGFVTGLEPDMRYNLRVYGYSRGGVGKMSSPVNQFQIIPKNKCVPGATWDGPDFRYNFICKGCLARAQLLVPCIAIFTVWLLSPHM